jgi:hypothetical protein
LSSAATLQLPGNYDHATLIIFNSNGQIVKQMKNISARTIVLNRDNLPSGIYYMRLIQDDKMSATDKIVIIDN